MNKEIINKIENIIKLSSGFDKLCVKIINSTENQENQENQEDQKNQENQSNYIYDLTNLYMALRSEHGGIIMILFNFKNNINENKNANEDEEDKIKKLYDLSELSSIVENINSLINNVDYQYKRISLMFPNLIKKNPHVLLLFTDNKTDKYVKMFEQMKTKYNEYKYKVVECNKIGSSVNCGKIIDKNLSIKITKIPSLYLIADDSILEIPITQFKSFEDLGNFIK